MEKNRLLLLPFLVGLVLMIYSWYLTYPLYTASANDYVFNHVSILYWVSLPLLLASMFLMAATTKSTFLRWILSIGIVLTFHSLSYFYFMMPGADSQYFRGLTEYFVKTKNLNASQLNHDYYQWPGFFVLSYIATSLSGLTTAAFEFLLYALIGFLLTTTLYVYASKKFRNSGFLIVPAFFVSIFYFLNYQNAPFSLALGLLFILLMLETRQASANSIVTILVLYVSLLLTHLFVPLFFVMYLLAKSILNRSRLYGNLFLLTSVSYLLIQLTIAKFSFEQVIINITKAPMDYFYLAETTFTPVSVPLDVLAQFFSRTVTIAFVMLCVVGFVILLVRRKIGPFEKSLLLVGILYLSLGFVLNNLGWRAMPITFIPISLGAAYLFESRFRSYLKCVFLVLLILFMFIPLHQSFNSEVQFQTREAYIADNFFFNHYNWENPISIFTGFRTATYLTSKLSVYKYINTNPTTVRDVNTILCTPELLFHNYTLDNLLHEERLNVVYNDGFSYVTIKAHP